MAGLRCHHSMRNFGFCRCKRLIWEWQLCAPYPDFIPSSDSHEYGIVLLTDSVASKRSMSDISLFRSFDVNAATVSLSTETGTNMTSRAAASVKFKVDNDEGTQRIVTVEIFHCA